MAEHYVGSASSEQALGTVFAGDLAGLPITGAPPMPLRVVAILVTGSVVNLYVAVAPSLLGALVDYQGMSTPAAGRLISYNLWGAGISTVLAITFLHRPRCNLRVTMLSCLLIVTTSSAAAAVLAGNVGALAVAFFVNGLGAGLGFTASSVALVGTPRMERSYAVLYGAPYMLTGAGLAFLPYLYRATGIEGAFYGIGFINLLACGLIRLFPTTVTAADETVDNQPATAERVPRVLFGLVLTALFVHYMFNSGLAAYLERLGVAAGMSPETYGAILGPSMSAALLGTAAAATLGDRIGYLRPVYLGTGATLAANLSLLGASTHVVFLLGTAVFMAGVTFATPYFIAILALLIPSGFGVTAFNIAIMGGFSLGPFLLSFFISGDDFTTSILLTAAGFVGVLGLVWAFARRLQHTPDGHEKLKGLCDLPLSGAQPWR